MAKSEGQDTETKTRRPGASNGEAMGVCRKVEGLELMSIYDCEGKRRDKDGPKGREFVVQSLKDKTPSRTWGSTEL